MRITAGIPCLYKTAVYDADNQTNMEIMRYWFQ